MMAKYKKQHYSFKLHASYKKRVISPLATTSSLKNLLS